MHNTLCGWTLTQIAYAKYSICVNNLKPTVKNVNIVKNYWKSNHNYDPPITDLNNLIPSACYEWAVECFGNATATIPTGARMKEELEGIIKTIAKKTVDNALKSEDVLRLTQSALNLAHTISVLSNIDKP